MHNRPLNHVVTIAGTPAPYAFIDGCPLVDQETREMVDRMVAERLVGNYRIGVGGTDLAEAERLLDAYHSGITDERVVLLIDTSESMPRDLVESLCLEVQGMVDLKFADVNLKSELRDSNRDGFYRDFEGRRRDGSFRRGKRGRK